jgi:hypothetical protein
MLGVTIVRLPSNVSVIEKYGEYALTLFLDGRVSRVKGQLGVSVASVQYIY